MDFTVVAWVTCILKKVNKIMTTKRLKKLDRTLETSTMEMNQLKVVLLLRRETKLNLRTMLNILVNGKFFNFSINLFYNI